MALPGSGSITIAMIATELGVSLPLDLNATNVRSLAGIASGNITMPGDFYGKSASDPVPDAINWANFDAVDDGSGFGNANGLGAPQTISGISGTIDLLVSVNMTLMPGQGGTASSQVYAEKFVGGAWSMAGSAYWPTSSTKTFTITGIANGTPIRFGSSLGTQPGLGSTFASASMNATATVTNTSNGGATLDTFMLTGYTVYNDTSGGGGLG